VNKRARERESIMRDSVQQRICIKKKIVNIASRWIEVGFETAKPTVAVCCSVLQCVAVCCSVLQCVAVCWLLDGLK